MITWDQLGVNELEILTVTNTHKTISIDHDNPRHEIAESLRDHGLLGYVGSPDSQPANATIYEITWEGRKIYSQWGNPNKEYKIVLLHSFRGNRGYYNGTIVAPSQQEAEQQAIKAFMDDMPFAIKGETIEIHSVNGVVKG